MGVQLSFFWQAESTLLECKLNSGIERMNNKKKEAICLIRPLYFGEYS